MHGHCLLFLDGLVNVDLVSEHYVLGLQVLDLGAPVDVVGVVVEATTLLGDVEQVVLVSSYLTTELRDCRLVEATQFLGLVRSGLNEDELLAIHESLSSFVTELLNELLDSVIIA